MQTYPPGAFIPACAGKPCHRCDPCRSVRPTPAPMRMPLTCVVDLPGAPRRGLLRGLGRRHRIHEVAAPIAALLLRQLLPVRRILLRRRRLRAPIPIRLLLRRGLLLLLLGVGAAVPAAIGCGRRRSVGHSVGACSSAWAGRVRHQEDRNRRAETTQRHARPSRLRQPCVQSAAAGAARSGLPPASQQGAQAGLRAHLRCCHNPP